MGSSCSTRPWPTCAPRSEPPRGLPRGGSLAELSLAGHGAPAGRAGGDVSRGGPRGTRPAGGEAGVDSGRYRGHLLRRAVLVQGLRPGSRGDGEPDRRAVLGVVRGRAVLHPVCSVVKMNLSEKLATIARFCCDEVTIPAAAGCCGFAGDRGFLFPELTESATRREAAEVRASVSDGHFSSSRTCEIGMTRATGRVYRSYIYLLVESSRPAPSHTGGQGTWGDAGRAGLAWTEWRRCKCHSRNRKRTSRWCARTRPTARNKSPSGYSSPGLACLF